MPAYDQQRAAAPLGGEAKEARRQDALAALLVDMPALVDEASAKRRCELLSDAASRGLLAGSQAGAAIRAVEVWLKLREHELDRETYGRMEAKVAELEAELARERSR